MLQKNHFSPASSLGFTSEPGGHLLTAKLTSIEHNAKRGDEVANRFEIRIDVSDGGRNPSGQLEFDNLSIQAGSTHTLNEQIFIGTYSGLNVGDVKFSFIAFGGGEVGVFQGVTEGDNELNPGTQFFVVPVVLEKSGGERSELIFRGRVDLV